MNFSGNRFRCLNGCTNDLNPNFGQRKPSDIIMIKVDELGFSDSSCYGSEINTPELDKLTAEEIRVKQSNNCTVFI